MDKAHLSMGMHVKTFLTKFLSRGDKRETDTQGEMTFTNVGVGFSEDRGV